MCCIDPFFCPTSVFSCCTAGNKNFGVCRLSDCRKTFTRLYKRGKERIASAQLLLAVALVLEAFATIWAFNQAREAGALYGDVDCQQGGLLERFNASQVTQQMCQQLDPVSDASLLATLDMYDGPTFCEDFAEPPSQEDSFLELCSCDEDSLIGSRECAWNDDESTTECVLIEDCRWIGGRNFFDDSGLCFATGFPVSSCTGSSEDCYGGIELIHSLHIGHDGCWSKHALGTALVTILTLVVALSGQVVEAFVDFREFRHPQPVPVLMTAASVFQTLGIVVVLAVLLTRPGFARRAYNPLHNDHTALIWLVSSAVGIAILGSLAEVLSCYLKSRFQKDKGGGGAPFDGTCRDAISQWFFFLDDNSPQPRRVHRLGMIGNAAVWLGVALFEVASATFMIWKSEGRLAPPYDSVEYRSGDWNVFRTSLAALLVVELVALIAMWSAKRMWYVIKLGMLEAALQPELTDLPMRRRRISASRGVRTN